MDGATLRKRLTDFTSAGHQSNTDMLTSFSGVGYIEGVADSFRDDLYCNVQERFSLWK